MPSTLQRWFLVSTAVCFFCLSGLPVALVQVYGWVTMYARYAEQMPMNDAIAYTFNGQETCGYCNFVEEAKDSTLQAEQFWLQNELRLLPLQSEALPVQRPTASKALAGMTTAAPHRLGDAPPGPPPRLA